MTVEITKVTPTPRAGFWYFDTLLESEGLAILLTGWKISNGRLFPPGRKGEQKGFYPIYYTSGSLCKLIWEALEKLNVEGLFLEEDGWISAKWGLGNLTSKVGSEKGAELHAKYKAGGKA